MFLPKLSNCTIAVIGLGYVGLPLAIELSKKQSCLRSGELLQRKIIGFDINNKRLEEVNKGIDFTNEISRDELKSAEIDYTNDISKLSKADVFIITVPTPIDNSNKPNLMPLESATKNVVNALTQRAKNNPSSIPIIIYESTVYPGATEEFCVPIIEDNSKLTYNLLDPKKGFACGYSPERINPGDKNRKLRNIVKVTSGSCKEVALWIDSLYGSIIEAGTHPAKSIKVAEAAKVIENTQRDINIALINELAIIFRKMGIDTRDVLKAAGSKWNFLNFYPGLVGGHCIGVDPYYLSYKSQELGYHPEVVLAGRRINNSMAKWIVEQIVIEMAKKKIVIGETKVLILGFTFKENCPDFRNTKVIDIVNSLKSYGMVPEIVDPIIDIGVSSEFYKLKISKEIPKEKFQIVICAVAHNEFKDFSKRKWLNLIKEKGIFFDIKGIIPRDLKPIRL